MHTMINYDQTITVTTENSMAYWISRDSLPTITKVIQFLLRERIAMAVERHVVHGCGGWGWGEVELKLKPQAARWRVHHIKVRLKM